jgi:hypothetical protein
MPRRFIAAFDNHGDQADAAAVQVFHDFCAVWKPEIRIHGGDCFDLRPIRRGAGDEERNESMVADVEAGLTFMSRLRPTHWLRGNHDERLWDMVQSDHGGTAHLAGLLINNILDHLDGVQILPYDAKRGILQMGRLRFVHGYHHSLTAARLAAQLYGSVVMGHVHAVDYCSVPDPEHRGGWTSGCLCNLRMPYNRAHPNTLRQSHGFMYGMIHDNGDYNVYQAQAINGMWLLPTEMKDYVTWTKRPSNCSKGSKPRSKKNRKRTTKA